MAFWNNFPFTNFHELNLDWIISKVKNLETGFVDVVKKVNFWSGAHIWNRN